jgi:erythromycin esterase-like protein
MLFDVGGKLPEALTAIRDAAVALGDDHDASRVLAIVGDASVVLLGEATHGTQEFYELRARITRALIEERGFSAVAIEGDWPDAYRVNRFVQGESDAVDANEALAGFQRFPTWMWRNSAVAEFVGWMREHNRGIADRRHRVGFYGLDLYSLHASMRAVVDYLEKTDPEAARAARSSYACFEEFGFDPERYAWATTHLQDSSCEEAVTQQLLDLRRRRAAALRTDETAASDELFYVEQNARLAKNAERYYRTMFRGHVASWNVRDSHMAETLEELLAHLTSRGQTPKVVVWAHNSHVGDARATEISKLGELNLGQLVRERHGEKARLVGFTTYAGTVVAASDWGEPAQWKRVRPALTGSYEELFHDTGMRQFLLPLRIGSRAADVLSTERLERAIGVIYRPETERFSHYFKARLAAQFDAVIHIDETKAVEPLDGESVLDTSDAPETYPSGV